MKHIRLARLALALTPLALSLAALPTPAPAQAPPAPANSGLPPGTPPLTPAQGQKQAALFAHFKQEVDALRANTSLSLPQKQQQFQTIQTALDKDMLAILTPTQQKAVLKQRKMVAGLHDQFVTQHQGEISQQQQLGAQLQKSITAPQKQKIALIQQQAGKQMQQLQADTKTALPVKQQTEAAIQRDAVRQMLAVMTPAQQSMFTKLQKLQANFKGEVAAFAKAHDQQ